MQGDQGTRRAAPDAAAAAGPEGERLRRHVAAALAGDEWGAYEVAKCLHDLGLFRGLPLDARRRLYDAWLARAPRPARTAGWALYRRSPWSRGA